MSGCVNEDKIVEYLEGELSDQEASVIREHLRGCAECSQLQRDWECFRNLATDAKESPESERFVKEVMKRLELVPEAGNRSSLRKTLSLAWGQWRVQISALTFAALLLLLQAQYYAKNAVSVSETAGTTSSCNLLESSGCGVEDILGLNSESL